MRNGQDCKHGWSSLLSCPFCGSTEGHVLVDTLKNITKNQEETIGYKDRLISLLKGQVADLDEQVAHLTKRLAELEGK